MNKLLIFAVPLLLKILADRKSRDTAQELVRKSAEIIKTEVPVELVEKLKTVIPPLPVAEDGLEYKKRVVDPALKVSLESEIRASLSTLPLPSEFIISRRNRRT